jgi:hypothetical protein
MNTTTIDRQQEGAVSGRDQRRAGPLACAVLALMATSAGLGAIAQRESGFARPRQTVNVVPDNRGSDGRGINHSRTSQCTPSYPGTRVMLLESLFPTSPCSNPPVLVSDRVSAHSSL